MQLPNLTAYLSEILQIPQDGLVQSGHLYSIKYAVKNEILLQPGEVCRHTYFVEKGLLRMYSADRNAKEHIIQFAPENWLISDRSSLYFNENSDYYIDAVEESTLILLDHHFFSGVKELFPNAGENNDLLLQKHIRGLQNRVNSLLTETAEERYLNFLKMYPDIMQRVPQWMVASYLGITPESLSRVRKELARKNFEIT